MRPALWFWITLSLLASPTFGWGNAGHQVVCEIAFQQMGPEARALVSKLRRNDPARSSSFAQSCIGPDDVRNTTHKDTHEYHFRRICHYPRLRVDTRHDTRDHPRCDVSYSG